MVVSLGQDNLGPTTGRLSLPPFTDTFTSMSAITAPSTALRPGPLSSSCCSSILPSFVVLLPPPALDKAFVVGPGHAPVPSKLVTKITGGHFVDMADLLPVNLQAVESEPQTFLDG